MRYCYLALLCKAAALTNYRVVWGSLVLTPLWCFVREMQGADEGANAAEYVKRMRQQNKLIMGIGHRIKSLSNPDMRVTIIKEYALKHFKNNKVLDFAMAVEQVGSKFGL